MSRIPTLLVTILIVTACGSGSGRDRDASDDADEDVDAVEEDAGIEAAPECMDDGDCDDDDPCTVDTCIVSDGACEHEGVDADGDGYHAMEVDGTACEGTDCDDGNDAIHPGAAPDCDGGDLDCDTLPDDDEDDDGFTTDECAGGDDCDDADPDVFPGAPGVDCSDDDNDCNDHPDHDNDGDGQDRRACGGDDCDDEDELVYWGAGEIPCDGKDTNCDGDMHSTEDEDHDTYPNETCAPDGVEPDCDDTSSSVYPGAPEICDLIDQDCDGDATEAGADDDGDGYLDDSCTGGDDCDDTAFDVHPGADEACGDGVDQDCDTVTDGFKIVVGDAQVTTAAIAAEEPVVVWTGSEFGVVWTDDRTGDKEIYLARVTTGGSKVGTEVDVSTTANNKWNPALAWTGSAFGMIWEDPYNVRFALHDASGTAIVADRSLAPANSMYYPRLAWTGSEFGAAWIDANFGTWTWVPQFTRVSASGTVVGSTISLDTAGDLHDEVFILESAWTGSEHAVFWYWHDDTTQTKEMRRVSSSGSPIGSVVTSASGRANVDYDWAWTGSEYGTVHPGTAPFSQRVRFERLSYGGSNVGGTTYLSDVTYQDYSTSIGWAGSEFIVTWVEDRGGTGYLMLTRVSPTGVIGMTPVRVTTRDVNLYYVADHIVWTGSMFCHAWVDDAMRQVFMTIGGYCE